MKVVEALVAALRAEEVDFMVNLPDEITVFVAQEFKAKGGRVLRPRHEENGLLAADGFARASGRVGVCMVGPGPALAHTAMPLVTASKKKSPVLVLLGRKARDTPRDDNKTFDARRFVESTGASFVSIRTLKTMGADIREAFRRVRLRNGPVVLEIPDRDTLMGDLDESFLYEATVADVYPSVGVASRSEAIEEVAALLMSSRRPLLFVGRGAVESGAHDCIVELADRVGALLGTSLQARSYFASNPRSLGILGSFASSMAVEFLMESDLVIVVGASLNSHQTGGGPMAPKARVVQIDSNVESVGRRFAVDYSIVADARGAISAIIEALDRAEFSRLRSGWAGDDLEKRLESARTPPKPAEVEDSTHLPVSRALSELSAILPDNRLVVLDGGLMLIWAVDQVMVPDPRAWIWTLDFGSIGLSLGMAMGAAVARPDLRCVVIVGDGGLAMSIQELETLVRERIPVVVVVVNDSAYSAEIRHLKAYGLPLGLAEFPDVNFAEVARAFGMSAGTVRSLDDMSAVTELLAGTSGPVLVDLKVSEDEKHRLR